MQYDAAGVGVNTVNMEYAQSSLLLGPLQNLHTQAHGGISYSAAPNPAPTRSVQLLLMTAGSNQEASDGKGA